MPILRFENVTKQFDSDSYGVYEINFSVEPGEFIFVTGPSGSGKTTLMRLLLKEYPFSSGEIFFHDTPLSDLHSGQVHLHRRKIGVVFQDYKLIPEMNIWENIALPLWVTGKAQDEVERRVTDLLNLIKLPEKALHFPSQLSGGEAQRVGIARALAIGPEIVIADEPTGNLDPETAQHVARLLKKINELGTTVIIATHDKNIIATYPDTRKIALEKGKLVDDTHKSASTTAHTSDSHDSAHKTEKRKHSQTEQHIAEDLIPETPADAATKTRSAAKTSRASESAEEQTNPQAAGTVPTAYSHQREDSPFDALPDESPARESSSENLPWWEKILGVGKKATSDSTKNLKSTDRSNNSDNTDLNQDAADSAPDDDLVTITEEALDDAGDITDSTEGTTKQQVALKTAKQQAAPDHTKQHSAQHTARTTTTQTAQNSEDTDDTETRESTDHSKSKKDTAAHTKHTEKSRQADEPTRNKPAVEKSGDQKK